MKFLQATLLRVFGHWKSTLLGVVLAAMALAGVWAGKCSWADTAIIWPVVLICLGIEDPKNASGAGGAAGTYILILVMASLALVGCRVRCPEVSTKTVYRDSIQIQTKDRLIPYIVGSETVHDTIEGKCPELAGKTFTKKEGRLRATATFDSAGKGTITCDEDSLKGVVATKDSLITKLHGEYTEKTFTQTVYAVHWYDMAARWFSGIALLLLLVFLAFKRGLTFN